MPRALCLLACFGALALGGCGGGGDATTTSETTAAAKPKTTAQEPSPQAHQSAAKDTTLAHAPATPGDPTAGAKAPAPGVPVIKEGDNSVQSFGSEGQSTQREQATADLRAYLDARAAGEWERACEATSAEFKSELAKAVSKTPEAKRPKSCAEILQALYGEASTATLKSAARVGQVLSFRVRDDGYAYLIFKAPEGAKFIAMANDGGAWKVNTPEPAAFQGEESQ